jgi:hypothetical protein
VTTYREAFPLLDRTSAGPRIANIDDLATPKSVERLMPTILRHLEELGDRQLAEALPGLTSWGTWDIGTSSFSKRGSNALETRGVSTWGDLGEVTLDSLKQMRNIGATTVGEIARRAILRSLVPPRTSEVAQPVGETGSDALPPESQLAYKEAQVLSFIRRITLWAQLESESSQLSDLLPLLDRLPTDLADEWRHIGGTRLTEFAGDQRLLLNALLESLLSSFEPTRRSVLNHRILTDHPITLQELGLQLGVTRERVRQIQVKVEETLKEALDSEKFAPLRWRAHSLGRALGGLAPTSHPQTVKAFEVALRPFSEDAVETARALFLYDAGPFIEDQAWLRREGAELPTSEGLEGLADEFGLIPYADVTDWFLQFEVRSEFLDSWLTTCGRADRILDRVLIRRANAVERCISQLAIRELPASVEVLVSEIGTNHNVRGLRARFFEDPRLMRVNKTDWALRQWGLEEYTGIADEIRQRVVEQGGSASLNWLVEELSSLFNVADGSVRAYAAAPMFVLEDGMVRLRRSDEPFEHTAELTGIRGTFRTGRTSVSTIVVVDKEILRGSGRSCPAAIALFLGIKPGMRRAFQWGGASILITWPETSAVGPSLGALREVVSLLGADEGDLIRLEFHAHTGFAEATWVSPTSDQSPTERIQQLTGLALGKDIEAALADGLDCTVPQVRRVLDTRGDREILALLGSPASDPSLESALSELANLLDEVN